MSLAARFRIDAPGRYVARVVVDTPYLDCGKATNPPVNEMESLRNSPLRVKREFVLPFEMVEGDPAALQRLATGLKSKFLREKDPERHAALAHDLFSLSEGVALRQWRSLAFDPNADRVLVARELADRVGTVEAARILIDVESDRPIRDAQGRPFSTLPLVARMMQMRPAIAAEVRALLARRPRHSAPMNVVPD